MTNLKKVLVFVVVFAMMLSFSASASVFPDVDQNASYAEAVSILSSLELMIGDEQGNFNPDKTITRAEAATIIVRAKGLEDAAAGAKGATQFTDVAADHWAAGYINLATQNGIIVGYGDGTFGPSDEVTYEQITKMIVATLGYTPMANQQGGYPTGYLVIASQKGIAKGTSGQAGEPAPRATVSRLLYNALTVKMMGQTVYTTGAEEYEVIDDTLLYDYLDIDVYEGIVTKTYASEGKVNDKSITVAYDKVNGEKDSDDVTAEEGKTGAAAYLGYYVVAYVGVDEETDEDTFLAVAPKSNKNDTLTVDYSQLEDDKDGNLNTVSYMAKSTDRSATDIELSSSAKYFYNGQLDNNDNVEDFLTQCEPGEAAMPGTVTFIDNGDGNDDEYDYVFVTAYTAHYVVDEIQESKQRLVDKNGSNIPIDLDDEDVIYTFYFADGSPASFEDIKVDNVISLAESYDDTLVSVYISDKVVEGIVSESRTDDEEYFTIDGEEEYRTTEDVTLKVSDEGKFYVNVDNRIVYKETTIGTSVDKYAYLYKAAFSTGIDNGVQVQFITANGEWKILDLATKVTVYKDIAGSYDYVPVESAKANSDLGLYTVNANADGLTYTQQLFKYDTNSAGKIHRIYLKSAIKYNEDGPSVDGSVDGASYNASQVKLGGTFLLEDTIVFNVPENGVATDDDDITVSTVSKTFKEVGTYTADFYDNDDDYPSVVVAYGAKGEIDDSTRLFVISKVTSGKNDNGTTVDRFYGYQEGEYVDAYESEDGIKYTDAEGNDLTGADASVQAGDVVIFSLDLYGDIDKIQVLMKAADVIALKDAQTAANFDEYTFGGTGDEDAGMNYFGWAESKSSNRLNLKSDDGIEQIMFKGSYNVYNVNLNRTTPVVSVIDYGDIEIGEDRAKKDTDFVFVRTYEGNVVDAVAYTFTLAENNSLGL